MFPNGYIEGLMSSAAAASNTPGDRESSGMNDGHHRLDADQIAAWMSLPGYFKA
jgi:hypothetical protein